MTAQRMTTATATIAQPIRDDHDHYRYYLSGYSIDTEKVSGWGHWDEDETAPRPGVGIPVPPMTDERFDAMIDQIMAIDDADTDVSDDGEIDPRVADIVDAHWLRSEDLWIEVHDVHHQEAIDTIEDLCRATERAHPGLVCTGRYDESIGAAITTEDGATLAWYALDLVGWLIPSESEIVSAHEAAVAEALECL